MLLSLFASTLGVRVSGIKRKSTWSYSRLETLKRLSKTMTYRELSEYFGLSDPAIRAACKKYALREETKEE